MKNPDYNRLYLELGLQPNCSVDELRQAYRRHVAGLHPDRGDHDPQRDGSLPLSDLNALYDEVVRFHQRYGRLPGATLPARVRTPVPVSAVSATADATTAPDRAPGNSGRRLWLALLLIATVVAALVLGSPGPGEPARPAVVQQRSIATPDTPPSPDEAPPSRLALGMDAETVLEIQGEPVRRSDVEWTYGPSWLRFERGKLVDWYSSQLRPLRTSGARPTPADAMVEETP